MAFPRDHISLTLCGVILRIPWRIRHSFPCESHMNTRCDKRKERNLRYAQAAWLKTQIKYSEDARSKIACSAIKKILEERYGSMNALESGHITRVAFPGIVRRKHRSGYNYYYYGLSRQMSTESYKNEAAALREKVGEMGKQLHFQQLKLKSLQQTIKNNEQELEDFRMKLESQKTYTAELEMKFEEHKKSNSTLHFTNKQIFTCISSQQLDDHSEIQSNLGSGAFGSCSLKFYRNIPVAVKVLIDGSYNDVLTEASIIKCLEGHPNLPLLFGISPKTYS